MAGLDYAHRRLVNTLGPERVARGEHERMVYSHDFASLPKIALIQWRLYPDFVVLPRTTPEVAAIVKLSDETGLPITPRGGGTGSVGAAVPNRGGVLLDLRSMNRIVSLDPSARTVTSEAGVTWRDLDAFLGSKGFALPVLPDAAPASTIGGAINGGAAGTGSFRHGTLRGSVLDLEVVLPDGSVLRTGSAVDLGGAFADLTPLFFGAEGTLGIVTQATLRVIPKPETSRAAAYSFASAAAAARFLRGIVDAGLMPFHAALLDREHFVFERALRADAPEPADTALVSLQGPKDEVADLEKSVDALAASVGGAKVPAAVALELWERRFMMYGARRLSRGLVIARTLVPVSRLEEGVGRARDLIHQLKLNGAVHATLLDTSTAYLAPYVLMDDTAPSGGTALGFVKKLGDAALELGGHPMGLGLFMVFNLLKMHGRATGAMGSVKGVFDPNRKVNGGKTTELWTKFTWPVINSIPPGMMGFGLDAAAFLRRIKPTRDTFVRAYERAKGA
ncbi:MAG: hypothetical protein A3K68_05825 [Euryarchaeota archaeon RBG_16_68_13]|nr:MAG: hypothetical protein A3K68_05825 [Euryarchaeota archaeon RBG_16_68_13]